VDLAPKNDLPAIGQLPADLPAEDRSLTDDPSAPLATLGNAASGGLARVTMMQSA